MGRGPAPAASIIAVRSATPLRSSWICASDAGYDRASVSSMASSDPDADTSVVPGWSGSRRIATMPITWSKR